MSRKFLAIALGTMMSAPVWTQAQTAVGTIGAPRGRISPLDTIREMLQRRNPTIDEVLMLSAEIRKLQEDFRVANERARRELPADETSARARVAATMRMFEEVAVRQRLLAIACSKIRPHEGESEGVLGFQIEGATQFQRSSPVVKEERFVRTPEIMFVEPNTPAAKADIREGDVWIAIEGRDLVNTYVREVNEVLKAGARVELKLRREGRELNVGVVPKKRADFPAMACDTEEVFAISRSGAGGPANLHVFTGPMPAGRDFFTMQIVRSVFFGADFGELTATKREMLKVKLSENEGVLVEKVASGSPAEVAGLREWDIVTRANNEIIESVADLAKVMQTQRQVTLWVVRGETSLKVILAPGR
jgi:hypothetical protein